MSRRRCRAGQLPRAAARSRCIMFVKLGWAVRSATCAPRWSMWWRGRRRRVPAAKCRAGAGTTRDRFTKLAAVHVRARVLRILAHECLPAWFVCVSHAEYTTVRRSPTTTLVRLRLVLGMPFALTTRHTLRCASTSRTELLSAAEGSSTRALLIHAACPDSCRRGHEFRAQWMSSMTHEAEADPD